MSPGDAPLIVRFFSRDAPARDARGRTLDDMLSWDDEELEYCHDYIQMLFPLPEGSMFNMIAPIVTEDTYAAFNASSQEGQALRAAHNLAFERILEFYGMRLSDSQVKHDPSNARASLSVTKGSNWASNAPIWLTRFNHNHLRITRIIRSLRVLGSESEALAFYNALISIDEAARHVGPNSFKFWKRAAFRPLHLPPDEDDEAAEGISWLKTAHERA